jgi:adenylate cyclase class IV
MKNSTQFSEIEYKYRADEIDMHDFDRWAKKFSPIRSIRIEGYDHYWRQGEFVVRHRNDSQNTLTVKCRKSLESIADRAEIDLHLNGATQEDVVQFLKLTGFRQEFSVWKKAHIFFVEDEGVELSLVIYDVEATTGHPELRFIEVEVEKSPKISTRKALRVLEKWDRRLRRKFGLSAPSGLSLYEIFSGKSYRLVESA